MTKVLVPVKITERTTIKEGRYPIRFHSGMLQAKRWNPRLGVFGRVEEALIDTWFEEVELPSGGDLVEIAKDDIPKQTHPEKIKLIVEGMRLMARHYDAIVKNEKGS